MSSMPTTPGPDIAELVRYVATGLVDKPDEVHVQVIEDIELKP